MGFQAAQCKQNRARSHAAGETVNAVNAPLTVDFSAVQRVAFL